MLKTEGVRSAAPHWLTQHRGAADGTAVPRASCPVEGARAREAGDGGTRVCAATVVLYGAVLEQDIGNTTG